MQDTEQVATGLAGVWQSVVGTPLPLDDPALREESLWSLGLTSADFIRLLTAIEDGFGLEWDLDDSVDAVASFGNLVAHVGAHATRLPAAGSGFVTSPGNR